LYVAVACWLVFASVAVVDTKAAAWIIALIHHE
jgi:hypothetical protein